MNILKLPVLWAAMVAIALNVSGYHPSEAIDKTLMMGAYASMTMQLVLFGIYLYGIKLGELNAKLSIWVSRTKFILIPVLAWIVLGTNRDGKFGERDDIFGTDRSVGSSQCQSCIAL